MPFRTWQRLFLLIFWLILLQTAFGSQFAAARSEGLHWEKIHVSHVAPTIVFAKLGLTHSTKNGHTRDGKQGVPDPTFPPGLTDVVPYDADKTLLVRGTDNGLILFRARVAAADVANPPLHLHAVLATPSGAEEAPQGEADLDNLADGLPMELSVGDGSTARIYQITERANLDGTLWIACRVSLPLPPPATRPDAAPADPVFVPDRVWTDPMSRKVHLGEMITFDDLASVRQAAAKKLGLTGTDAADDYQLSVTLTPMIALPAVSVPTP
jgi:hypothetical protein